MPDLVHVPVPFLASILAFAATDLLHAAYLLSGLLMGAAYWTQIRRAWLEPEATLLAQSLPSWLLWTACRLVALMYGICVVHDSLFVLTIGLDVAGRIGMLVALLRAGRWQRRKLQPRIHRPRSTYLDQIGRLLRNRDHRCIRVAADDARHD